MHPDQKRWDSKHRRWVDREASPEPHQWVTDELESISGIPVIDLASGISAVPENLREKECPYFALDISPVALRETQVAMREGDIQGGVCQADLEQTVPLVPVEGIYVLTFFYSPFLFRWVADHAKPGSKILAETYCRGSTKTPISEKYCLAPGELKSYYDDWTITFYGEREEGFPETARLIADK